MAFADSYDHIIVNISVFLFQILNKVFKKKYIAVRVGSMKFLYQQTYLYLF
ncbi:hypothetical protein XNC3_920040 [Xenorhabdus nematophila F1]|nr:hypothetical protein XNC3_920040 [Xenorhabdus nematophila F1]